MLTPKEFFELAQELDNIGYEIIRKKNPEYSDGVDFIANFRFVAREVGISPYQTLYTYMRKHWASIAAYCKDPGAAQSEPIELRLADSMNYHRLLFALIKDV